MNIQNKKKKSQIGAFEILIKFTAERVIPFLVYSHHIMMTLKKRPLKPDHYVEGP